jgi:hypothetical protein
VSLDDLARDGQPEACPANVSVRVVRDAEKLIEDPLEIFPGDAYAAVTHTHLEMAADCVCR